MADRGRQPPPAAPRVLWFVPSLAGGGAERICIDLANAMSGRGVEVAVVTAGEAGERAAELVARVRLIELGAAGVAAALPALVRVIREYRPSVLVSVMDHANLVAWLAARLARSSVRIVFTTHIDFGHAFEELRPAFRQVVLGVYAWVYRRVYRRVAVSDGVADSIAAKLAIPRAAIDVVHNPIATERVRALARAEPSCLPQSESDMPLVVAIGRLVPQKDFAALLRAAAIALRSERFRLVLLGEGPERHSLERLAGELGLAGVVQMPGFVANPYAWLGRARVFVSSSRWEGFGLAILEAMALGVPVVATDCRSGPAEILSNGAYGRLVPVSDEQAMARALLDALRDPGRVEAARERAAHFDVEAVTTRYLELVAGATP